MAHDDDRSRIDIHVFAEQVPQLDEILNRLRHLTQKVDTIMSKLDDAIAALNTAVAKETTVTASAIAAFNGIPKLITDAVNAALDAGATPQQLQAVTDAATAIQADADQLTASLTTNTGASPGPVSPGTAVQA